MLVISRTKLKFSGIYCIINLVNQKRYIGSSKNISQRLWCHRANLRHNKHENKHLQNAWNKYGEDMFQYFVLEKCDEEILIEREQFYIDTLNPEYNQMLKVVKPEYSVESRKKLSETRKKLFIAGLLQKTKCKKVYQFDLDGNFIEEYESIHEAARQLNCSVSHLSECLNGALKQFHGFQWNFTGISPQKYVKSKIIHPKLYKPVYITDLNNNILQEFESVKACANYYNKKPCVIGDVIKKKRVWRKQYMIKFKDAQ